MTSMSNDFFFFVDIFNINIQSSKFKFIFFFFFFFGLGIMLLTRIDFSLMQLTIQIQDYIMCNNRRRCVYKHPKKEKDKKKRKIH